MRLPDDANPAVIDPARAGAEASPGDFLDVIGSLRGGVSLAEADLLRSLATATTTGCIVEIGSFRGKSATAFAFGALASDRPEPPRIFCIEPHGRFTGFYGGQFSPEDRGAFFEVMLRTGFYRMVSLVNLPSEVAAPNWHEPIGLLFIDGDHFYESVRRDFSSWTRHVVPGGVIAFDDATDPSCGPQRVITEMMQPDEYSEIARCGKIIAFRKLGHASAPTTPWFGGGKRILIACDRPVLSGGFLRMERIAEHFVGWGHEVAYVAFGETDRSDFRTRIPLLPFETCSYEHWHSVIVPGAGFPDAVIEQFSRLRQFSFGTRVQLILNDTTLRARFVRVNRAFAPHIVVFNNRGWPGGSFTEFSGGRFYLLEGAVDTKQFRPLPYRAHRTTDAKWTVGGLANKNPAPLIGAMRMLPDSFSLRLFGPDIHNLSTTAADLVSSGRLELLGPILGDDLRQFYDEVDLICMTELNAGWANLVAEAMASGLPVICTSNGTSSFAKDGLNVLIVNYPTPAKLAQRINQLANDAELCRDLGRAAREKIETFDMETYAQALLKLSIYDGKAHYYYAPEMGLYGKWPLSSRVDGLNELLTSCKGGTVLDLGAAEGLIARAFLEKGASLVHGFDIDRARVIAAMDQLQPWTSSFVRVADVANWNSFCTTNARYLLESYDIVLYLGLHHHLPERSRIAVAEGAASKTKKVFAIRAPGVVLDTDNLDGRLSNQGFERFYVKPQDASSQLGELRLYRRPQA